jgi:hypothetical protein
MEVNMKKIIQILIILILSFFLYDQLSSDQQSYVSNKLTVVGNYIGEKLEGLEVLMYEAEDLAEIEAAKLYDLQGQLQNLDETGGTFTYNGITYSTENLTNEVEKIDNVLSDITNTLTSEQVSEIESEIDDILKESE